MITTKSAHILGINVPVSMHTSVSEVSFVGTAVISIGQDGSSSLLPFITI